LALLIATTATWWRPLLVTVLAFHRRALGVAALALLVVAAATHHVRRRALLVPALVATRWRSLETSALILLIATATAHERRGSLAVATLATLPHGRPQLFQLLQLLGRQDLLEFRLRFGLQVRHLFLLLCGEVQLLLDEGWHQPEPARHATALTIAGAAFITGTKLLTGTLIVPAACLRSSLVLRCSLRVVAVADLRATLRGRGRRRRSAGVLLRGHVERREAERQRGGGDEFLHGMVPFNYFFSRPGSLGQS
jgi:hypothetical protein